MIRHLKILAIFLLSFLAISCNVLKKTGPRNLEQIYNANSSTIHPDIKIYNNSDTSSIIVLRVYLKELLFNQANTEKKLQAEIKVEYNLYDLNNKQSLVDSAIKNFRIEKNSDKSYYTYNIPIRTRIGNKYFLEIITTDSKRNNSQNSYRRIDRIKEYNEQDFLIYKNNSLSMNSFINESEEFDIKHYKEDFDSLNISFYSNNFNAPKPPFEVDSLPDNFEVADTVWTCYLDSIDHSNFKQEGVYYFSTQFYKKDQCEFRSGFALYNFGKNFPVVKTPEDLIKPLIYLDSIKLNEKNDSTGKFTKLEVDNFWLNKANNIDKSRELLKIFYNRVMYANKYFTSYKEGWQTDRGMIYIIYGLPNYLFKSGIEERWIYNPLGMGAGITFTFNYIEDSLSLNHFKLDRAKLKYTGWDEALEVWNEGEVFYFQK